MSVRRLLLTLALGALLVAPTAAQHRVALQTEGRLLILAADGSVEWEMPCGEAPELHALPNGNLMLRRGAREVVEVERETRGEVWSFDVRGLAEETGADVALHGFEPLPDGNVLLALGPPARVVEVDRQGRVRRELPLQLEGLDPRRDLGSLQLLEGGGLLLCTPGAVRQLDGKSGALTWRFVLPSGPEPDARAAVEACRALRLPDGNTLVATGVGTELLEVRPSQEILWFVGERELQLDPLPAITQLRVLESGHVVLGNAQARPGQPLVVELDLVSRQVVWRLDRPQDLDGSIASLHVLDGGPEGALRERARRIHRAALTLDTHKDISTSLASPELPEEPEARRTAILAQDPTVWGTNQVDFPKMRAGGLDVAFYIVYVGQGPLTQQGFADARATADQKFETIERMLGRYPEHIELARTPDDVQRIAAAGKLVCCIGIENGYAMGEDLSAIEEFHRRGARYMSITHNRHSQLGDSNTPEGEPIHGGLSDLGRRAIEEMNRVGILVDISHAGEETTLQAIAHSKAPVIASHSGVDGVRLHGRNLSDAELLALKENGGVLQCVAFASYVKDDAERRAFIAETRAGLGLAPRGAGGEPSTKEQREELRRRVREFDAVYEGSNVADFVDHIDYAVKLIGLEHVAISSDFDGGGGVVGWNDASETFNVTLELVRRGYTAEEIEQLWSGNTLRVWRAVERVAARLAEEEE